MPVSTDKPMISFHTESYPGQPFAYGGLYVQSFSRLDNGQAATPQAPVVPGIAIWTGPGEFYWIALSQGDEVDGEVNDANVIRREARMGQTYWVLRKSGDSKRQLVFCEASQKTLEQGNPKACYKPDAGYVVHKYAGPNSVRTAFTKESPFPLFGKTEKFRAANKLNTRDAVESIAQQLERNYVTPEERERRRAEGARKYEEQQAQMRAQEKADLQEKERFIKQSRRGKTVFCSSTKSAYAGASLDNLTFGCSDIPSSQTIRISEFVDKGWSLVNETRQPVTNSIGDTVYTINVTIRKD